MSSIAWRGMGLAEIYRWFYVRLVGSPQVLSRCVGLCSLEPNDECDQFAMERLLVAKECQVAPAEFA